MEQQNRAEVGLPWGLPGVAGGARQGPAGGAPFRRWSPSDDAPGNRKGPHSFRYAIQKFTWENWKFRAFFVGKGEKKMKMAGPALGPDFGLTVDSTKSGRSCLHTAPAAPPLPPPPRQ